MDSDQDAFGYAKGTVDPPIAPVFSAPKDKDSWFVEKNPPDGYRAQVPQAGNFLDRVVLVGHSLHENV